MDIFEIMHKVNTNIQKRRYEVASSYAFKEQKKYASASFNSCKIKYHKMIFLQKLVQWKLVALNLPAIIYNINYRTSPIVLLFLSLTFNRKIPTEIQRKLSL